MPAPQSLPAARSPLLPRIVVLLCLAVVLALIGWMVSQVQKDRGDALARARSYLDRGQPDRALQVLAGIPADGPDAADGLTLAARAFLMRGNIARARRVLERSLTMKRAQPEADKMLAAIYLAASDAQRAITLLKEAAQLEPGDFHPWSALGKVYQDQGKLDESAGAYAEALRRRPPAQEAREARIGRFRALLKAHRHAEAAADLAVLREQTPNDPQVLALAAQQARDRGQVEEATELAQRALAADPTNYDALLVRARIHVLIRQPQLAIEDLEKALGVQPDDPAALQLLAQAQMSAGLTDRARATQERANRARERIALLDRLTRAIDEHPEDPEPRWRLGQAAMEAEMYLLAYQCFQAALDLNPNYTPARDALEALRSRKGFDLSSLTGPPIAPLKRTPARK